ncbi:MAG: molybdopterin converting factor, subunit 1 [Aeromicrobium sp.]|nr:molybdopterin converting factor, subunit 1 [Aeromicrobium sp.]
MYPIRAPPSVAAVGHSFPIPPEDDPLKILFINNNGGGFADHVEISEGTTVNELFAEKMLGKKPVDYLIRVNRLPVSGDQVLQANDRISITPTKIEGARAV